MESLYFVLRTCNLQSSNELEKGDFWYTRGLCLRLSPALASVYVRSPDGTITYKIQRHTHDFICWV